MKKVIAKHIQGNRFEVFCGGSKNIFYCDKPEDESLSSDPDPIDLFLASLGTCVALFSGIYCRNHGKQFSGLRVDTSAELSQDSPQRLRNIEVKISLELICPEKKKSFCVMCVPVLSTTPLSAKKRSRSDWPEKQRLAESGQGIGLRYHVNSEC